MTVTGGWCRTSALLTAEWLVRVGHCEANRDGSAPSNNSLYPIVRRCVHRLSRSSKHIVVKVLHKHPTVKQGPHNETKFWLFVELW